MKIVVSAKAGFCFGVRRSYDMTLRALQEKGTLVTLGPIIHNPQVVEGLKQKGVYPVEEPDLCKEVNVILRSHGETPGRIAQLEQNGCRIIDTTCPCVKRIHEIAQNAKEPLILIGEKDHPEVKGILGWAKGQKFVVDSKEDIEKLPCMHRAIAAVQTTCVRAHFEKMAALLKERIPCLHLYDTICASTQNRLKEAEKLAKTCSYMIVVGGKNSSNTRKLVEVCQKNCKNTIFVETAQELRAIIKARETEFGIFLRKQESIGITAGASTPDEIIEEVVTVMSEMDKNIIPQTEPVEEKQEAEGADSNFLTEFEKTVKSIRPGQTVVGTVVQITEDEVCVNIGYKADGLVPRDQLIDPKESYKVGDEVEVEIVKVNDGEGNVLLSQKNIVAKRVWNEILAKHDNGEYIKAVGSAVVKGGLIANLDGVRIFVPASHLAERYIEKIDQFVGKELTLKIIEVDKAKKRLVASRKEALIEENKRIKEAAWEKLVVGETVHGIVRRITAFGAFVDIGGVDGLVHITDLSWGHIDHPSSVVKPGDEIDVLVLNLDRERERISLGLKQLKPKPWETAQVNYPAGSIVEGKVVRITTFGAFVELEPGLDGLVHISQISQERIAKVEDALTVGQIVRVRVLDVNPSSKRISLSIKEAQAYEDDNMDMPIDEISMPEIDE